MKRSFLAALCLMAFAAAVDAGPLRNAIQARREARSGSYQQMAAPVVCLNCTNAACQGGTCACAGAGTLCDTSRCPIIPQQMPAAAPFGFGIVSGSCVNGQCPAPPRVRR